MKHLFYIVLFISSICLGQDKTIIGTVTDETGSPLPGVTVTVEGTINATSTDADGRYTLTAQNGQTLGFTCVEAKSKSVAVTDSPVINITMEEWAEPGNDVIIVGFGKKSVSCGVPISIINTYKLTQTDKESIYKAAFNGFIVQQAIKANFNGKSKLYERGYELEFISLFINDSISIDVKKRLLTGRILADWHYDETNGRPKGYDEEYDFLTEGLNLNGNELSNSAESHGTGYRVDRNVALADLVLQHNAVNFSRMLYAMGNRLYMVKSGESLQMLLGKLRQVNIVSMKLLTGVAASFYGSDGFNGVVVIKTKAY